MKKIIVPGIALSLLLSSSVLTQNVYAHGKTVKQQNKHAQSNKKTGLENALQKVKNSNARAKLQQNLKKHAQVSQKADVSLSKLMVGGVDASKLAGLTNSNGAILKVVDFSSFKGITATAKDVSATVSVTLNGSNVLTGGLTSLTLKANDLIVVTVKNGITTQTYKVKLVEVQDVSLSKFTIGGMDISNLQDLTSQAGATLKVSNFDNFKGIVVTAKDTDAMVSVMLNGSIIQPGNLAGLVLRVNDVITVVIKNGVDTQTYKVTLQQS